MTRTPKRWDRSFRRAEPDHRLLRFSFRYLDSSHESFDIRGRGGDYFRLLLVRMREISDLTVGDFVSSRLPTLRVHPIDFSDPRVAERSFYIRNQSEADERAWQFALSANEHGRVHGFLVEDTFYVRWLDPDHNLYPG